MPTLYEIDTRIIEVIERGFSVDEETGEVWDASDLDALEGERIDKLEACALYIKDLRAEADAIKREEAALKARRDQKERRAESLRAYVAESLQNAGHDRMETPRVALTFRRSKAVQIIDETLLPTYLITHKVTETPNKTAIKKAIEAGDDVPGAALVENRNLQIK